MAVPTFEKLLYLFLNCLKDGDVTLKELRAKLTEHFWLTPSDLLLRTKRGNSTQVNDRINWARQYFRWALFIEIAQNGTYRIKERGKEYLKSHTHFTIDDQMEYPEYAAKVALATINERDYEGEVFICCSWEDNATYYNRYGKGKYV